MDRRTFLATSAINGLVGTLPIDTNFKKITNDLQVNPGIDRARASFLLKKTGLDGIVLGRPENVYYATGNRPVTARLGITDAAYALIPAQEKSPIIYIAPQFTFYYAAVDPGLAVGVDPYLVTAADNDKVAGAFYFAAPDDNQFPAREKRRRQATDNAAPYFASTGSALSSACNKLGFSAGRLGHDCKEAANILASAVPAVQSFDATHVIKNMRLIKSYREVALMTAASKANVAAAKKTAANMRSLGTIKNARNHFNAEVSRMGNMPGFMVVNGAFDEAYDEEFIDGTSVLIDCVSSLQGYHGDYGRTIFIGEPLEPMATKVRTMAAAWNELRSQLKPGMRFSEVRTAGTNIVEKMGHSLNVPFNPHCVGLAHTEQPMIDQNGVAIDTVLEKGMIISVDCPLMEATNQGTAHLEDLTLITEDGSRPIHDVSNPTIIV